MVRLLEVNEGPTFSQKHSAVISANELFFALDKKTATITGNVPSEVKKIVFTAEKQQAITYFSADGKGKNIPP